MEQNLISLLVCLFVSFSGCFFIYLFGCLVILTDAQEEGGIVWGGGTPLILKLLFVCLLACCFCLVKTNAQEGGWEVVSLLVCLFVWLVILLVFFIACLFICLVACSSIFLVGNFDWQQLMHAQEGGKSVGRWN